MRFAGYTKRGLEYAVKLANVPVDPSLDVHRVATELLQDESRPRHRPPTEVTEDDLDSLRWLSEQARRIFEAGSQDEALVLVNRILEECGARPVASRHDGDGWHMHFAPDGASASDLIGATAGMSLALLICDYGLSRIGVCEADGCYKAYADQSKNNRKRYCSARCTTRSSVAAHRQRVRESH